MGTFTLPGLLKIKAVRKPATKSRKMISPFTGQEITVAAKPASRAVKVQPLSGLKRVRGNASGDADQAPPLACSSADSTETARRVEHNLGGMIDYRGIHLNSAAPCPTNRDHLTSYLFGLSYHLGRLPLPNLQKEPQQHAQNRDVDDSPHTQSYRRR